MRITPTHPRTMNGLRGFGFTVTWGDDPSLQKTQTSAAAADEGLASPASAADEQRANTKDAPHASNDDFKRIQVLGSINE